MVRHHVSFFWLHEHRQQTCVTDSPKSWTPPPSPPSSSSSHWAHLQAAGAERYEFTPIHPNLAFLLCSLRILQTEMRDFWGNPGSHEIPALSHWICSDLVHNGITRIWHASLRICLPLFLCFHFASCSLSEGTRGTAKGGSPADVSVVTQWEDF